MNKTYVDIDDVMTNDPDRYAPMSYRWVIDAPTFAEIQRLRAVVAENNLNRAAIGCRIVDWFDDLDAEGLRSKIDEGVDITEIRESVHELLVVSRNYVLVHDLSKGTCSVETQAISFDSKTWRAICATFEDGRRVEFAGNLSPCTLDELFTGGE